MLFSGQTQLLTPAGVLPLGFEIEAKSLDEALQKFPDGVKVALEQAIDEAREMRREAASRIVVPDVGGGGPVRVPARRRQDQVSLSALRAAALARRARPLLHCRAMSHSAPRSPRRSALLATLASVPAPRARPGSSTRSRARPDGKPMRTGSDAAVGMPPAANQPIYPLTARSRGQRQLLRHQGRRSLPLAGEPRLPAGAPVGDRRERACRSRSWQRCRSVRG